MIMSQNVVGTNSSHGQFSLNGIPLTKKETLLEDDGNIY